MFVFSELEEASENVKVTSGYSVDPWFQEHSLLKQLNMAVQLLQALPMPEGLANFRLVDFEA